MTDVARERAKYLMEADVFELPTEESHEGGAPTNILELRGEIAANVADAPARRDRTPPFHEGQRRGFANGPEAHAAAFLLQQALRLLTPQAVSASLLRRAVGRVEHRFSDSKSDPVAPGSKVPLRR